MKTTLESLAAVLVGLLITTSSFAADSDLTLYGGVSGGGGNVINPTPPASEIDSELAESLIKNSMPYVKLFLKNKYEQYQNHQMSSSEAQLYAKIFEGSKNIMKTLSQVKPAIEEHRPCFTMYGEVVDASIVSLDRRKFCVSALTISKKVAQDEIPVQSAALMIHEYGEIVGVNEDEAIILQKQALQEMNTIHLAF